jgi:hypothetical protein
MHLGARAFKRTCSREVGNGGGAPRDCLQYLTAQLLCHTEFTYVVLARHGFAFRRFKGLGGEEWLRRAAVALARRPRL